ncbi:MAG: universal stress protein [Caulobacteraceae bacterium]
MTYKTILVHVRDDGPSAKAVEAAVGLARQFDAHVLGVGAEMYDISLMASAPYIDGTLIQELRDQVETHLTVAQGRFRKLTLDLGSQAEWLSTLDFPENAVNLYGRTADLVVAARPAGHVDMLRGVKPADLIMRVGLPVLLVPNTTAPLAAKQVVIGWKDTREARRAVSDALPLLMRAEMVHVVAICGQGEVSVEREGLEQLAQRLRRHGVAVSTHLVHRSLASVAEDLEHVADLHGADLLVLGAYGHTRVREWAFGGVTEDLLMTSSKYVLLSH